MSGGPARKPSEPIEETAAIAGPGRRVGLAPGGAEHQRHAVGDAEADEEQAEQRRRAGWPISSIARERHAGQQRAPAQQRDRPDAAVDGVADHAADGHPGGEEGVGERGERGARAEVLAQVEAAPVRHRALGDHDQQAEQRRAGRRRATAARSPARRRPRRRSPRPTPRGEDDGARAASAEAIATRSRGVDARARRTRAANAGARHAAEGPAGVQRGHDRPAEVVLDLDAVAVHRDVHRRAGRAEHEQPERDEHRARREHRQVDRERARRCRRSGRHAPRAVADDRLARDGKPTMTATDMPTIQAHRALERSKRSCTHGMCATQVPMAAPLTAKTPVRGPARGSCRVTVTPAAR